MRRSITNHAVHLAEGETVAFRGARGDYLECMKGAVWLTVEGQPGDFLLAPGARLRIESNGLVVIEGMPDGVIERARQVAWPVRWAAVLSNSRPFRNYAFFLWRRARSCLGFSRKARSLP